ncbi:MAG: NHLP leader peptide family RiPP precursor [Solidesulfovibrio sp. DCME]|uniref:NHLP leader peptide family RiPP precursor n=1 Tax=Solidesulfovibrio sp. DCME TaxID=3447380 RepID=UPI003D122770
MTKESQDKKLGQIIAKAWEDAVYKQRLLKDATKVLKEEGVTVPEGLEIKAVENTEKVSYMVDRRDAVPVARHLPGGRGIGPEAATGKGIR